jgi:type I restriction enzyme R subunit
VYTNDETKRKFQVLSSEVFRKYKAIQPDKILNQYAPRKNAIDVIYNAIENNIESADVSEIMKKIQNVVDESIENMVAEPGLNEGKSIDLSGLDFELLEQYFLKTKNKNAAVQSLKNKIENQLKRMLERNPLSIDFYKRYQEIIDKYNRGKDEVVIKDTFRKLIELVNSFSIEEAETKREGLTDEQKAIFDILRNGKNLSNQEKKDIKKISIELLEELKHDKLKVELWADKSVTAAAVFNLVSKTLFETLPYPAYQSDEIDLKTNLVYEHLKQQYFGGGMSIYGQY